jgi:tetratricopeptide (TPR) repeat protein
LTSASSDQPGDDRLAGQVVVFTGKLSLLGRREARALVTRLGGVTGEDVSARTTMLVIGAEGFGRGVDGDKSQKLKRAEELNAARRQVTILSEAEFCVLAGMPPPEALKRQYSALRDLLHRYSSLREDQVRYLVKCGAIRPALRTNADVFFAFTDVATIRQVHEEVAAGASFRSIVRSLLASRLGQLAFDFRLDAAPARVVKIERRAPAPAQTASPAAVALRREREIALAEDYFRIGSSLDSGDEATLNEAAAAYRRALELDPYLVAALINLANIHYGHDELVEAQALYERAIGLEPDFFEAHFNLGNIYHDLGRFSEAQRCYSEALRLNPVYADAHFYLAVTFEKMGLSDEARPHWRAYRQLAPEGEWVDLAREFSD